MSSRQEIIVVAGEQMYISAPFSHPNSNRTSLELSFSEETSKWVSVTTVVGFLDFHATQLFGVLKWGNWLFSITFLRLFTGAEFASRFRRVILSVGRMPTITRRIRFLPGGTFSWSQRPSKVVSRQSVTAALVETTRISFWALSICSTESILPHSSQRWRSSLCDSWLILLSQSFRSELWSCAS